MSGQTQAETALQSLAEKLRTDAIAIFGEGQSERDIIEWFYGALLAAAPATPAAQGAVPEGERLAELLESVRLGDDEAKPHGSGATYWNNAVLACQVAIRDALAAPAHPAERQSQEEVQRLRQLVNEAFEFINKSSEHDSACEVFNLDDDDRHQACNCGLETIIRKLYAALSASTGQEVGK